MPSGRVPRLILALAWLLPLVHAPVPARADVPHSAGGAPTCTVDKELRRGGGPCEACRGWSSPDPCQEALENKGYTRRCTEGGAGSFVAVWCRGATTSPPASTTPAPSAAAPPSAPSSSALPPAPVSSAPPPAPSSSAPPPAVTSVPASPPVVPAPPSRGRNCCVSPGALTDDGLGAWLIAGVALAVTRRRAGRRDGEARMNEGSDGLPHR